MAAKYERRRLFILPAVFAVIGAAACTSTSPSPARPSAEDAPAVLPLSPYLGRLVTAAVSIGGKERTLIFDTGGGQTSISPRVAQELGCVPFGRQVGFRMSGERVEMPVCDAVAISVSGAPPVGQAVGVLDIAAFLPKEAPPVDGTLALSSFAGGAVTIDLAGRRLIRETAASLARRTATMREFPVRLATGPDGAELVAYVGIPARGGRVWLELDSANLDLVLLDPHAAAALGVSSAGESADPVPLRLNLTDAVAIDTEARVRPLIHDGALNAAFFLSHVVTLDLRACRLWIGDRVP